MNRSLSQRCETSLLDDPKTLRKLELNYRKNREQDNSPAMDTLARQFRYEDCREARWNPDRFSLLYGTNLLDNPVTEAAKGYVYKAGLAAALGGLLVGFLIDLACFEATSQD